MPHPHEKAYKVNRKFEPAIKGFNFLKTMHVIINMRKEKICRLGYLTDHDKFINIHDIKVTSCIRTTHTK